MILIFSAAARRRLYRSAACMLALPLWLAGCASIAPPASTPGTAPQLRAYQDNIELGGRLSVRYQQNGSEQAVHGSFSWSQTPGHTHVVLASPLGQTIAEIDVTPAAATLMQANQPPRVAADVDTLATETLGWPLPVAGLRDWLQGFVAGANGARQPVPVTPDATLDSDGWRIRYASWQQDGTAPPQPKRLDLEREGSTGPVAIRIVIDTRQILAAAPN
jgi:outer membrane lipoprotein LolB